MRTNPNFWSDEFEIFDDPDLIGAFEVDPEEACVGEAGLDFRSRHLTPWQRLEERLGERELRADFSEWDYWDEYLTAH